jgi:hypothetical protein
MTLSELLDYSTAQGRICPKPQAWNTLYQNLLSTKRIEQAWEPPLPLILGAWHFSSDDEKADRFRMQLLHADAQGGLEAMAQFVLGLKASDWHYSGE